MESAGPLILNVDDTEAGRYAKSRALRHAGFEVVEATTGRDALRLAGELRPPLVLLDIKLPDMSGLEVCRVIKRDWPEIMVLQISASYVTGGDRARGLDSGADSYLTQPVEPNELVASVRALLRIRAAEAALRESEDHYRHSVELNPQMPWTARPDGTILDFGPRWLELTGQTREEAQSDASAEMLHPDDRERSLAAWAGSVATGEPYDVEHRVRLADRTYRWMRSRAFPRRDGAGRVLRWYGTTEDISGRKDAEAALQRLNETLEGRVAERTAELAAANARLQDEMAQRARAEEQFRQAQKMEAVGQLTGGMAHDFNNLLTIVMGSLDIIQRLTPPDGGRVRRAVENGLRGAERAATLTHRLLAFSRRQPLDPKPIDANRLMAEMSELLRRALGETVELETVLGGGIWQVEADANQLESAILNLAVNARDAMPAGGKLTIETANVHLDDLYAHAHAEVVPGQYVLICVSDTGEGMDKDTLGRVFEPFFTTKEPGKGTGLGLSQVYGFVKQSSGHVKVYSEPGQGTTVKIYLPRFTGDVPEEMATAGEIIPEGSRKETVLVVEDDDDVRAFSVEVLRELGYRVIEAHDGPSALRLLERQPSIDLLFTDVVLPSGLNGQMLAAEAKGLKPGLKVLFTTGYARNAIVHHGRLDPGVDLITKPFTYADLAAKVRDVLDANHVRRV